MKRTYKRIIWTLGTITVVPLLLVCIAVALAYFPPVQKWLINEVGSRMEEQLGMRVHVDDVRITPFLDLQAEGVTAVDAEGDTLIAARLLTFDVAFRPLLAGRADVDGFSLDGTRLNTKSLISDISIVGTVGHLGAEAKGIEWTPELVHIVRANMSDANLFVTLTDTAAVDSTEEPLRWIIDVDKAHIHNTRLHATLPPDSIGSAVAVDALIKSADMRNGHFDLGKPYYAFKQLQVLDSEAAISTIAVTPYKQSAPADTLCSLYHLGATIDTLSYNSLGTLRCGVNQLAFDESKYNLHIREISGGVYLDSTHVELPALNFHTAYSRINGDLAMDWDALKAGDFGQMKIKVDASIGNEDVREVLNIAVREKYIDASLLKEELLKTFLASDVNLQADVRGNLSHLTVDNYNIVMRKRPLGAQVLKAHGSLDVNNDFNNYAGRISAEVFGGVVAGRFKADIARQLYDVSAEVSHFPLAQFVDGADIGAFTGRIDAKGQGFNPTAARSRLQANIKAQRFKAMGYDLNGLCAGIELAGKRALGNINLHNALGYIDGNIEADLSHGYDAYAHIYLEDLNLRQLFGISDTLVLSTVLDVHATASNDFNRIAAEGSVSNNYLSSPHRSALLKDVDFALSTTPHNTTADIRSGDLALNATCLGDLDYIARSASRFTEVLMAQLENKAIDQQALREAMPTATLRLHAGSDNPLHNYLYFTGTEVASIDLDLAADQVQGINGSAQIGTVNVGNLQLDTIYADITHDDKGIKLCTTLHNYRESNPNRFTASVDANLEERGFNAMVLFKDEKGKTGIDLGVRAETFQGTARFTLYPANPVFAYRSFTINDDNFISINRQGMIRANVHLVADDGTGLLVYSEPTDESTNDVTLSVYNLNLKELCDVMPYMPRLSGNINGDFHVIEEHGEATTEATGGLIPGHSLSAMGTVEAQNFAYEGTPIGDIGAELIYMPKENGEHYADAFISFNGDEVGECSGVYDDTNGQFKGDISLSEFPLHVVNAFLEGTDFMMRGNVGGNFSAQGTLDSPVMNGEVQFADAHFYSPVYGVDFQMEERPIVFENSRLTFSDYLLNSGNTDLKINGNVNMTDLSRIRLDLAMKAQNFALINTARLPSSLVFGRLMANYNGTVRGLIDNLAVRGQLDILPTTDVTYLLTSTPLTVEDRLADLVTFVDFNDTTVVEMPSDETSMLYDVTLGINIDEGAKFHCFLSSNGKSYVDVKGGGNLTFRTTQEGNMSVIGRCTVLEGKMNYELPVIPMKTFDLQPGSYVEFSGDMYNPRLSIQANQETRAIVSDDDAQRSVDFVVGVDISRTLEDMGLAFTIDAPDDLSVQNQLATMSEEDRYKTAVALLATGMYVTENLTTGLKASSALNAFLQNEIQSIAGKALSTFDLSFGMENGLSSAGTTTTDYSFKFSKRFLDDRISINIGGSISTGQNATNNAASFIDNISIEYRLDNSSSRYVHVFYDRDSHDPLEGSMMTAGAGLVLRRKTDRLGELFLFRRKKE